MCIMSSGIYTNWMKTGILLSILGGILLGIGFLIGGYNGLIVGFVFALLMNGLSYWFSDKIVLFMNRCKQVSEKDEPRLFYIVKDVSQRANLPMPKVYIVPSMQANAFATGRNPKNAAVACTQGILKLLSDDELKGVIAHEIAHVKNRDILISTIAATIASVISFVGMMARWSAFFGGSNDDNRGGNIISLLVLGIITPIMAMLIQLAISRSREYLADETGARIIKNPDALARALEKIDKSTSNVPLGINSPSTSSLYIANPFKANRLMSLLSTHPPMELRVKKLRELKV